MRAGYRWYGDVFDADLPYVLTFGPRKLVAIPLSYDVNDMPSMKYGSAPKMMHDAFDEVIIEYPAGLPEVAIFVEVADCFPQ